VHVVLPRDSIMAIWNPQFDAMERAERYMRDEEPVLGLVGDRILSFELELDSPHLVDLETRSRWSVARGEAIAGPLKGARAPAYPAFGVASDIQPEGRQRNGQP